VKLFETRQIREARAFAAGGGQALHLMTGDWARGWGGPACFQRAKEFAHLFDQDVSRLIGTARRLGVRKVAVHGPRTPGQHVDLCGRPLRVAKRMAAMPPATSGESVQSV